MFISGEFFDARFLERPNRFIIRLILDGEVIDCHLPNPGRMKEFLLKDKIFRVKKANNEKRKTKYTAIGVYHEGMLISLDTRIPNKLFMEAYENRLIPQIADYDTIKPEVNFNRSRLDFFLEKTGEKCYVEVKSCTLVENGVALFPDAPTTRGQRHLRELMKLKEQGFKAMVFFIIQRSDSSIFKPNIKTDPEFGKLLKLAKKNGVEILAYDSIFKGNEIRIGKEIQVDLD